MPGGLGLLDHRRGEERRVVVPAERGGTAMSATPSVAAPQARTLWPRARATSQPRPAARPSAPGSAASRARNRWAGSFGHTANRATPAAMTTVHAQSAWRANRRRRPPPRRLARPRLEAEQAEQRGDRGEGEPGQIGPAAAGRTWPDPPGSRSPRTSPTPARGARPPWPPPKPHGGQDDAGLPSRARDQPPPDRPPPHAATRHSPRARRGRGPGTPSAPGRPRRAPPSGPSRTVAGRPHRQQGQAGHHEGQVEQVRLVLAQQPGRPHDRHRRRAARAHAPAPHPRPARARAGGGEGEHHGQDQRQEDGELELGPSGGRAEDRGEDAVAGPAVRARRARAELPDHVRPPRVPRGVEPDRHPEPRSEYGSSQNTSPTADRPVAAASAPARARQPPGSPAGPGGSSLRPGLAAPLLTGAGRPGAPGPRPRDRTPRSRPGRPTMRRAPALTTSGSVPGSSPPIANQGRASRSAADSTTPMPAAGRPTLVGVACTGPTHT